MLLKSFVSCLTIISWPCFNNFGGILSILDTFLVFRDLIAVQISTAAIFSILMSVPFWLLSALLRSYVETGFYWLSTSLKCSTHLSFCSSSVRSVLLSLFFLYSWWRCLHYYGCPLCSSQYYTVSSSHFDEMLPLPHLLSFQSMHSCPCASFSYWLCWVHCIFVL